MKKIGALLITLLILCCAGSVTAQAITTSQDKWDLKRCVEYALTNNLSVKQTSVQADVAEIAHQQARWQQYPSADFSHNTGLQWGRSIDPTTNQFTSNQLLFQGFNLSAGITVYNWNRIRNNIIGNRYEAEASKTDVERVKNTVALNVATSYLQVLLMRQQIDIVKVQMQQTLSQLELARKKVDAGAVPQLEAFNLEGQFALDSSSYITAVNNADQELLNLKQLLNIDAAQPFDIATPPVDQIPVEPLLQMQPETVFEIAMKYQPAQKMNELRIKSLEAFLKSNRANMFPTISLGGSLGTNFSSPNKTIIDGKITGFTPNGSIVNVNGAEYPILDPQVQLTQGKVSFGDRWTGWGTQVNNNFRQSFGLSISVPINAAGQARFNYARSKLNLKSAQITKSLADQTLKNDIYKAYYSASAAWQKFNASKVSVATMQKTYDFAVKRYELGLLNSIDLLISQNNLTRAKLDLAAAQFDYVFKMKVLEFYKGQGLTL
jgi:outer membrane protein